MMQHKSRFAILILFLASLGMSISVYAKKKRKRTTVNFEDQLITGQNQKPDVLTIFKRKNLNYKRLIRLRENFLPEMRATGNEIDEGTQPKLKRPRKKRE